MVTFQFATTIANVILKHVRGRRGMVTAVSKHSGINRREFTNIGLQKMKAYRLERVFCAIQRLWAAGFTKMMSEISALCARCGVENKWLYLSLQENV